MASRLQKGELQEVEARVRTVTSPHQKAKRFVTSQRLTQSAAKLQPISCLQHKTWKK